MPVDKCEHGHYKAGAEIAKQCSACNPSANTDRPLALAMAAKKPPTRIYGEPRELSTSDYMALPVGERLARAGSELWG